MYEVEAKVWVKDERKWKDISEKVKTLAKFQKEESKADCYFGLKESKQALFRLRTINQNIYEVTIKDKIIKHGIEQSKEESFQIDNVATFLAFTQKIGLEIILKKQKHSLVFQDKDILIELNHVQGLGNFLEIEVLNHDKTKLTSAQKKILETFDKLGFSPKDFEKRPYLKILQSELSTNSQS